ncbi:NfeD family protein [Corynebacterium sputi]|uniref:NfeD family protein n=1 Tax=Corynebacterium sputi TaxID=489915 RepID=UPI000414D884|nr:NfeD family protein [Corynebacterium sputi]
MSAIIWLGLSLLLLVGELFVGEFFLLMVAGGALATAGVSMFDIPLWGQVAVFVGSTALLTYVVRPVLKRRFTAPDRTAELEGGAREIPGRTGEVVEPVSASQGMIRVAGQLWSARSLVDEIEFEEGDKVTIVSIDGNTAVVDREVQ